MTSYACNRPRRALAMRTEDLRPVYVSVLGVYPLLNKFRGTELSDFFAVVRKTHLYESFQQKGDDGAVLETESERTLELDRGSMHMEEYPRTGMDLVKKNVVDLTSDVKKHFGLYAMRCMRVRIEAVWPIPDDLRPAVSTMRRQVLTVEDDQYQMLGETEDVGIRLIGHRDNGNFGFNIEISSDPEEEGQLNLRLETHSHDDVGTPAVIGEFVDKSWEFLHNNVAHFVNTLFTE